MTIEILRSLVELLRRKPKCVLRIEYHKNYRSLNTWDMLLQWIENMTPKSEIQNRIRIAKDVFKILTKFSLNKKDRYYQGKSAQILYIINIPIR